MLCPSTRRPSWLPSHGAIKLGHKSSSFMEDFEQYRTLTHKIHVPTPDFAVHVHVYALLHKSFSVSIRGYLRMRSINGGVE